MDDDDVKREGVWELTIATKALTTYIQLKRALQWHNDVIKWKTEQNNNFLSLYSSKSTVHTTETQFRKKNFLCMIHI